MEKMDGYKPKKDRFPMAMPPLSHPPAILHLVFTQTKIDPPLAPLQRKCFLLPILLLYMIP